MMNIFSMNIRGLGVSPKYNALKCLFFCSSYRLILIQETMLNCHDTISYFRRMFPSWYIASTKASGLSGGLDVIWDPRWVSAKTYRCLGGILISAYFRGYSDRIHILIVYSPYKDKASFWDPFIASGILESEAFLIAGDFNCTMGPDEVWGRGEKSTLWGRKSRKL